MNRHFAIPVLALTTALASAWPATGRAAEPNKAIEQALSAMQTDKRGITVHVNGQALGGAVVKVDASAQTLELRGPQGTRIVVRLDRIDAVTLP